MRIVLQRVNKAAVLTGDKVVGEINKGYFILLGVKKGDTEDDAKFLAKKISALRVMSDGNNKMNLNLEKSDGEILVVSQFTLYANTKDGNRPSFIEAADPDHAKKLYNLFVKELRQIDVPVKTGSFGEYMSINAELDGPVTIIFDTDENH